jgi:hypothetical protein
MADQVRINGNALSWGSIRVKLADEVFSGFTSLAYGDKLTIGKVWGMGKAHAPRARSRGKYETDPVKLAGPKSTIQALRARLAQLSSNGQSYGQVVFQITAEYVEAQDSPQLVEIEDCRLIGNTSSDEENPDPLKEEVEIDCMRIRRNGLTLFEE